MGATIIIPAHLSHTLQYFCENFSDWSNFVSGWRNALWRNSDLIGHSGWETKRSWFRITLVQSEGITMKSTHGNCEQYCLRSKTEHCNCNYLAITVAEPNQRGSEMDSIVVIYLFLVFVALFSEWVRVIGNLCNNHVDQKDQRYHTRCYDNTTIDSCVIEFHYQVIYLRNLQYLDSVSQCATFQYTESQYEFCVIG